MSSFSGTNSMLKRRWNKSLNYSPVTKEILINEKTHRTMKEEPKSSIHKIANFQTHNNVFNSKLPTKEEKEIEKVKLKKKLPENNSPKIWADSNCEQHIYLRQKIRNEKGSQIIHSTDGTPCFSKTTGIAPKTEASPLAKGFGEFISTSLKPSIKEPMTSSNVLRVSPFIQKSKSHDINELKNPETEKYSNLIDALPFNLVESNHNLDDSFDKPKLMTITDLPFNSEMNNDEIPLDEIDLNPEKETGNIFISIRKTVSTNVDNKYKATPSLPFRLDMDDEFGELDELDNDRSDANISLDSFDTNGYSKKFTKDDDSLPPKLFITPPQNKHIPVFSSKAKGQNNQSDNKVNTFLSPLNNLNNLTKNKRDVTENNKLPIEEKDKSNKDDSENSEEEAEEEEIDCNSRYGAFSQHFSKVMSKKKYKADSWEEEEGTNGIDMIPKKLNNSPSPKSAVGIQDSTKAKIVSQKRLRRTLTPNINTKSISFEPLPTNKKSILKNKGYQIPKALLNKPIVMKQVDSSKGKGLGFILDYLEQEDDKIINNMKDYFDRLQNETNIKTKKKGKKHRINWMLTSEQLERINAGKQKKRRNSPSAKSMKNQDCIVKAQECLVDASRLYTKN